MSKENSDRPEQSRCVEELMNSRLGANGLAAVICDNTQIKEHCIIIVNKTYKGFVCLCLICAGDNIVKTSFLVSLGLETVLKDAFGEKFIQKLNSRHRSNNVAFHLVTHIGHLFQAIFMVCSESE